MLSDLLGPSPGAEKLNTRLGKDASWRRVVSLMLN
ncbi:hypothetical protein BIW11_04140 [Tropilaelaps mercedesae]|uniref:Uncharacterized protein n=1 Tax=Tropilaelaps mercedesae TaxID=418985 RepID=A0A1V9XAG7_9ACAR|nr:hypothetical protein BIW11_04140 [Tropilaelaps mercedesae]